MSMLEVSYLDLLHELCRQRGYALLLTAKSSPPGFAKKSTTEIVNLEVVRPLQLDKLEERTRRYRLRAGELVIRCTLEKVDGDLQAAAELVVQMLTRRRAEAA